MKLFLYLTRPDHWGEYWFSAGIVFFMRYLVLADAAWPHGEILCYGVTKRSAIRRARRVLRRKTKNKRPRQELIEVTEANL